MQKTIIDLQEKKLVGIKTITNNASEMNSATAKIGSQIDRYFQNALAEKILDRKNPGTTYCVYTNYESDYLGDYTYFIGEEVTTFDEVPVGFQTLIIPIQNYAKFTSDPGPMPEVCINMWKAIWSMRPSDLGGERSYIADFEVYDKRSQDHQRVVLDIYIGIRK